MLTYFLGWSDPAEETNYRDHRCSPQSKTTEFFVSLYALLPLQRGYVGNAVIDLYIKKDQRKVEQNAVRLTLTNPNHAEKKTVKIGWSWTCFLFSGFFGIPLFLRGLTRWASIAAVLSVISGFSNAVIQEAINDGDQEVIAFWGAVGLLLVVGMVALSIYMGVKGNKLTGVALLNKGWMPEDPESAAFLAAKKNWALSESYSSKKVLSIKMAS